MTSIPLSRRRLLTITAAAALLPAAAWAAPAAPKLAPWRGRCLGAEAEIRLYHQDEAAAKAALAAAVDEVERLEGALSLFRPDSALSRLNRAGRLDDPPFDLLRAITEANAAAEATGGAFDITVQPLWALYADSLARTGRPPSAAQIAAVRPLIGWRQVRIDERGIRLARPGMALTLNGMGQGYVTDRIGELLIHRGFPHVLVDLGELRAPAGLPDGSPWSVAVRDPNDPQKEWRRLSLASGGMATSEAFGSSFRPGARDGHILDPKSLRPAVSVASVTVRAPTATRADLLSTAIAAAGPARAAGLAKAGGADGVLLLDEGGRVVEV